MIDLDELKRRRATGLLTPREAVKALPELIAEIERLRAACPAVWPSDEIYIRANERIERLEAALREIAQKGETTGYGRAALVPIARAALEPTK
jgi:hypothetical protein